jgi:hypothetical protein
MLALSERTFGDDHPSEVRSRHDAIGTKCAVGGDAARRLAALRTASPETDREVRGIAGA